MTTLVCDGRPVRRFDNTPTGDPCGQTYDGAVESARVAGWRIGPARVGGAQPVMCPGCARPAGPGTEDARPAVLEPLPGM